MTCGEDSRPIVVAQIMGKWIGGGVEAVIMNYYRHINHNKVQFDFICDEDSTNIPYEEIEKLGGRVIMCPPYQKLGKYMKFLENLFHENRYRIVHSNINTLSVFPLRAAKKAGVPVRIAHSHSTSNPEEKVKNVIKNTLRPFSRKYVTDYFACSQYAARYLFGKAISDNNVLIINNAIDVKKYSYNKQYDLDIRKELGISETDFVVGHIGRFVKQKNHDFLIDMFANVCKENSGMKLILIGQGPLLDTIKRKVEKEKISDKVLFLGQRNDANRIYSMFDLFCLPSLYEGLPVVGVEAQIANTPCLFSDKITEEVKISKSTKFISIKNLDEWSSAIVEIYKRGKPKRGNVGKIEQFDIEKQASKLEKKYIELANKERTK